ncbi:Cyclic nucleotide-gated cation channel alpha-3 (Cone photoreceptor cGMP-gated channel subunit alpha) (Cyclic nucleotide-gated channel alpha-3) (CNG channel alpha-3) (CNG-3) (CNG3) [Durusdinium trenchii]|uniref:Cyclic nucleotide-gated cation channel alpha-3 (Cone photoreceptor cGMP-gated channel subunit alpha) (Cyclic nucleotide-gated channel alpha-3) (CNG channel alpha-3) (CNG-3) (CNG3) n=1 Tax=Durusdinium trenchii TaxID=1381693 RepID=A0ABP0NF71_9DINO
MNDSINVCQVRTVRLLRLVKLKRILATIKDRITSEAVFILLNICKLILLLLLVNHFIAATWYLVGTVFEETHNWVDEYKMRKDQAGLGYRYSTSLHWSLTQFTPASMDVHPQNVWERYFAIMVLIAGLVLFSSFISSITGSMSQLRNMKADKSKQFWLLRRYLKQQKVPRDLCFRVTRYIEYALKTVDERVPEERITILTSLTDQLRNELKFFTHFRCLVAHPMFCYIRKMSEAILNRMSGRVLHTKELAAADPLFSLVDAASEMFFIQQGNIHYGLVPDRSRNEFSSDWETASVDSLHSFHSIPITDASTVLEQDDYLCEVAIWCNWAHVGVAQAMDETTVIGIDVKSFCDLTLEDADLSEIATLYSRRFVEKMSEDPTWVEVSHEDAKRLTSQFFLGREP